MSIFIVTTILLFIISIIYIFKFVNLTRKITSLDAQHNDRLLNQKLKMTETLLDRQRAFMKNILNNIPIPIQIRDVEDDLKYIFWNIESANLFGDQTFANPRDGVSEEVAQAEDRIDRVVFDTEKSYFSNEIFDKNGIKYNTNVHKSVIYDGDKKLLLIVRWDVGLKNELQRKSRILSISMDALNAFTWYCDLRDQVLHFGVEFNHICSDANEIDSMSKFAEKIHQRDRDRFMNLMSDFMKQDSGDFLIEYEIDLKGVGVYEWWECRATIEAVNVDGVIYKCMYGMDINIDKHKLTELSILKTKTELDDLNKQNELILNNTNSGLVFIGKNYKIEWENLSSFLPNHPIAQYYKKGKSCYQLKGLSEPCSNCVVAASAASGKIEIKEVDFNGQIGELTATPIFDNENERVGTVLKVVDITEKKRTNLELESKNILMRNIIDSLPCLVCIKDVDDDFRHIIVNNYFRGVLGLSSDQIIGKTDYELFPTKEAADKCRHDDMLAVESNDLLIYEEETYFNGKRVIWQTTKTSFKTANGQHLLIAISLDITGKILAYEEIQDAKNKAEQSNKLKSAFLANMSHEIRTPLNAIVGFSELMIDAADEDRIEYAKIVNTNNELLLRLISDILDLSKIEAGMLELRPVQFDVSEIMRELVMMFERRVDDSNVELICEIPYDSCVVVLDKNRFTQVVTNFIVNAIKFTPKGRIKIGYEYIDGILRVFVSDTGIGIERDKAVKVFERFEKLDDFAQGTGLGMAICKAIIEAHEGQIGVESEVGVGSTFWARIPVHAIVT